MNDNMLNFVKGKLEENEGIAPDALARLLAAAKNDQAIRRPQSTKHQAQGTALLLAASLAVAACGWFVHDNAASRRESNLTNVIALLQAADDDLDTESSSLADALLSWQDAPSIAAND